MTSLVQSSQLNTGPRQEQKKLQLKALLTRNGPVLIKVSKNHKGRTADKNKKRSNNSYLISSNNSLLKSNLNNQQNRKKYNLDLDPYLDNADDKPERNPTGSLGMHSNLNPVPIDAYS